MNVGDQKNINHQVAEEASNVNRTNSDGSVIDDNVSSKTDAEEVAVEYYDEDISSNDESEEVADNDDMVLNVKSEDDNSDENDVVDDADEDISIQLNSNFFNFKFHQRQISSTSNFFNFKVHQLQISSYSNFFNYNFLQLQIS